MNTIVLNLDVRHAEFHLHAALEIPFEGVTAVFGPSGCGKTTFLRCVAGLERSGNGLVQCGEAVWQNDAQGVFLPISQRPIGYVFQEPRLFPHLSVRSNLEFGLKRIPPVQRKLPFEQIIEILGIQHLLDRRPYHLSGGEQQRVAIGRALLTSPALLLMDEPLSSLDAKRKQELLPFIHKLDAELRIPIIYVSHSLQEILQLASTVVFLKEGKVTGVGPLSEVLAQIDPRSFMEDNPIGAVIDTTIAGQEPEFGLTKLTFSGQHLYVPHLEKSIGERQRVQIHSRDVSIIANHPTFQSSVLNVLEATVTEIGVIDQAHPFVDIKLDIGWPLLATITRKSLAALNLQAGQRVYAQIKTVALSQPVLD